MDNNGILDASELKSMITSQNIGAKIILHCKYDVYLSTSPYLHPNFSVANSVLPQHLEEKLLKFTGEVFKIMDTDNNGYVDFEVQRNIYISQSK